MASLEPAAAAAAVAPTALADDEDEQGPTLQVEATDVVKVVLQFLRESGLRNAADALAEESGVSLNAVPSVEGFRADVASGRWSDVLPVAAALRLPRRKLEALYEQVVLELCEAGEGDTARSLLAGSSVLRGMREREATKGGFRYARLESAAFAASSRSSSEQQNKSSIDPALLWGGGETARTSPRALRDARRAALADSLAAEVVAPPPGRLLTLLGQALRYHHHLSLSSSPQEGGEGGGGIPSSSSKLPRLVFGPYDLLLGAAAATCSSAARGGSAGGLPDAPPSASGLPLKLLRFGAKSHPEAAAFSPDGTTLATGSADGFIELWHATNSITNVSANNAKGSSATTNNLLGTLRTDLPFQKEEQFMMHDSPILSLAFSPDSALLASGDKEGCVKVWRASTGQCLRRLEGAHSAGVTALAFAPPSSSASAAAEAGGGGGGGPSSSSTSAPSSSSSAHLLSASYDGTARVHGLKSGRVLRELRGHSSYVTCAAWSAQAVRVDSGLEKASRGGSDPSKKTSSSSSFLLFGGKQAIVTGSADGSVRWWDAASGECLASVVPPAIHSSAAAEGDDGEGGGPSAAAAAASASASPPAVVSVAPHPRRPGLVVAATRSPGIHLLSFAPPPPESPQEAGGCGSSGGGVSGVALRTVPTGKGRGGAGGDAVALALTRRGRWALLLAEDGVLYCFSLPSGGSGTGGEEEVADEEEDDDEEDDEEGGGKRKKKKQQQRERRSSDPEFAAAVSLERVVPVVVAAKASAAAQDPNAPSSSSSAAPGAAAAAAALLAKKHAPASSLAAAPIGVCAHPLANLTATWSADGELKLWEGRGSGGDGGDGGGGGEDDGDDE